MGAGGRPIVEAKGGDVQPVPSVELSGIPLRTNHPCSKSIDLSPVARHDRDLIGAAKLPQNNFQCSLTT